MGNLVEIYHGPHNSICMLLLAGLCLCFSLIGECHFLPLSFSFYNLLPFKAQLKWQMILEAIHDYLQHDRYLILQDSF